MLNTIRSQTRQALCALLQAAKLQPGDILVLGGSSSEIVGQSIGTHSSVEAAEAVLDEVFALCQQQQLRLAVQCCEHLNRALIVEADTAKAYGWEPVNVLPQPKAGGAFATCAHARMKQPVAVEHIRAHAGMDIGQTFIGMHMREVCVPVRTGVSHIGSAVLSTCRSRPKLIGGSRAVNDENLK